MIGEIMALRAHRNNVRTNKLLMTISEHAQQKARAKYREQNDDRRSSRRKIKIQTTMSVLTRNERMNENEIDSTRTDGEIQTRREQVHHTLNDCP